MCQTAIILAAGRGSRMKNLTDERPKCLLTLAGKTLLEWQLAALQKAHFSRIIVVRGYKADMLTGPFETIDNPRWNQTNMVTTLLCAFPHLDPKETVIVAYADIVYRPDHLFALKNTPGDIALTYYTNWQELWQLRQGDPLIDSETFLEYNGLLLEIGRKPTSLNEIHGQYMGLLKFSPKGRQIVTDFVASLPKNTADKLDMTSLLQGLLKKEQDIMVTPVSGGWCECDTPKDIELYEERLASGVWLHDWRVPPYAYQP